MGGLPRRHRSTRLYGHICALGTIEDIAGRPPPGSSEAPSTYPSSILDHESVGKAISKDATRARFEVGQCMITTLRNIFASSRLADGLSPCVDTRTIQSCNKVNRQSYLPTGKVQTTSRHRSVQMHMRQCLDARIWNPTVTSQ
jgi:hypothetical protein